MSLFPFTRVPFWVRFFTHTKQAINFPYRFMQLMACQDCRHGVQAVLLDDSMRSSHRSCRNPRTAWDCSKWHLCFTPQNRGPGKKGKQMTNTCACGTEICASEHLGMPNGDRFPLRPFAGSSRSGGSAALPARLPEPGAGLPLAEEELQ